jgi:hypothetical protein
LTAVGLTLGMAALAAGPSVWARAAAVLGAVGAVGLGLDLAIRPLPVVGELPSWGAHQVDLALRDGGADPWTALVVAASLPLVVLGLARHLPGVPVGPVVRAAGPVLLAVGAMTAVLLSRPTLLGATTTCAAAVAVGSASAFFARRQQTSAVPALVLTCWPALHLLRVSAPSHLLSATAATALVVLLTALVARGADGADGAPVAAVPATLLAGYAALRWTALLGGSGHADALVLALAAAAAVLAAGSLRRGEATRVAVELGAIPLAAVALGLATDLPTGAAATAALVLTILGTAGCLVAVLHTDRTDISWVGTVLLGIATVVRVADHVGAPERWTMPAAALLLAAGGWRMLTDAHANSPRMLGSGLTLALLPSLLLALDEPLSDRGVLVAFAGLVALAIGVGQRWAAPFAAGAVVTAVLAIRHLGPVAEALPRWISLGAVGAVLLAVGVTWESRRRNLAAAGHYLTGLR